MSAPSAPVAAYVLHLRAFRESGAIVDFFTRDHGRVSVFAHGVGPSGSGKRPRNGTAGLLQPFTSLLVSWRGAADGGQLAVVEAAGPPRTLPPARLMSGFYLNELLLKLMARDDAHPNVFDQYHAALEVLAAAVDQSPLARRAEAGALRRFEHALLEALGLCGDFSIEAGTGEPLDPQATYRLRPGLGLMRVASGVRGLWGADLLAMAEGRLDEDAVLATARLALRELLDAALDGRPLLTRQVARGVANVMQSSRRAGRDKPDS